MNEAWTTKLAIGAMVIAFPFAFYFVVRSIFHMYKVVTNITGKYASFYGPLLLLMPSQLNEKGNEHRIKLLYCLVWVILTFVVLFGGQLISGAK